MAIYTGCSGNCGTSLAFKKTEFQDFYTKILNLVHAHDKFPNLLPSRTKSLAKKLYSTFFYLFSRIEQPLIGYSLLSKPELVKFKYLTNFRTRLS